MKEQLKRVQQRLMQAKNEKPLILRFLYLTPATNKIRGPFYTIEGNDENRRLIEHKYYPRGCQAPCYERAYTIEDSYQVEVDEVGNVRNIVRLSSHKETQKIKKR